MPSAFECRKITTEETIPLRSKVLRPFHPVDASRYPKDPEAVHFGAFQAGALVSTVTAHPEPHPLFPEYPRAWRIRGMATEPDLQGKGAGRMVLQALLDWARGEKVALFWCNAREGAIPFYEKHGFTVESELFDIAGIGPHKVMKIKP